MKKLIILSTIVVSLLTVAFVSKSKPPTFVEDLEDIVDFMDTKEYALAHVFTHEDSVTIFNDIHSEVNAFKGKWDVGAEIEANKSFIGHLVCRAMCLHT